MRITARERRDKRKFEQEGVPEKNTLRKRERGDFRKSAEIQK